MNGLSEAREADAGLFPVPLGPGGTPLRRETTPRGSAPGRQLAVGSARCFKVSV